MNALTSPYRCRLCAAASYRRLTHRGPDGAMQYSGLYRCSGCSVTFSDPLAWREGADAKQVGSVIAGTEPSYAASDTDTGHNSSSGHLILPRMPGQPIGYGQSDEDLREIRETAERANRSKGRRRQ